MGFGSKNIQSDGLPIDGSFTFELGYFSPDPLNGTFAPAMENMDVWGERWITLDQSPYVEATGLFGGEYVADDPSLVGERLYIWGYNGQEVVEDLEWLLFTGPENEWAYPTPSAHDPEPLFLRVSTAGPDDVVFGGVDGTSGEGDHTDTSTDFGIRTHTIPEPSASLLAGVAGLLLAGCRRRRIG